MYPGILYHCFIFIIYNFKFSIYTLKANLILLCSYMVCFARVFQLVAALLDLDIAIII